MKNEKQTTRIKNTLLNKIITLMMVGVILLDSSLETYACKTSAMTPNACPYAVIPIIDPRTGAVIPAGQCTVYSDSMPACVDGATGFTNCALAANGTCNWYQTCTTGLGFIMWNRGSVDYIIRYPDFNSGNCPTGGGSGGPPGGGGYGMQPAIHDGKNLQVAVVQVPRRKVALNSAD